MGEPKHGEGYVKLVKLISNKNEAENKKFGVLIPNSSKRNNLFSYNIKDALLEKCKTQIEQREKYREEIETTQEQKQKYPESSEEIIHNKCYEPLIQEKKRII